jgi:hypothetical protein
MSDIIMSLVGAVKFYYIPSTRIPFQNPKENTLGFPMMLGIKKIAYSQLVELILSETSRDILVL